MQRGCLVGAAGDDCRIVGFDEMPVHLFGGLRSRVQGLGFEV
jgi:hypothetical protein